MKHTVRSFATSAAWFSAGKVVTVKPSALASGAAVCCVRFNFGGEITAVF